MKILTLFCVCALMLNGCAMKYQRMQAERDQILKDYGNLREEHSELKIKTLDTGVFLLFGKWKFLNLEVEESDTGTGTAKTEPALHTLDLKILKNLTLEFFEENGFLYYRGKTAGGPEVFGKFIVFTIQYGNHLPATFIRFIRYSGPEMFQLLFAVSVDKEPAGPVILTNSQGLAAVREIGIFPSDNLDREMPGIMNEFSLRTPGMMQLGPTGSWVQSSGLRYYFEKIKK